MSNQVNFSHIADPSNFLRMPREMGRSLLKDLSYVTTNVPWALPLRKGYVEITERDFNKIQVALGMQHTPSTS